MTKAIVLDKIAYEPHPLSVERKRELNSQGYQVIDAIFAPPGTATAAPKAAAAAKPTKAPAQTPSASPVAADALALAGGNFMAFKSAAKKVLGDALPATKPEIVAALEALTGGAGPISETPDGIPTPVPDAWEAMTDEELIDLAGKLAGEPINAGSEGSPADKARSIIQATVDDRASKANG